MSEQSHLHNFDVTRFGFVNAELVVVYFVAIGGCRKRIYLLSGGVHVRSADAILNFVLGSELCLSHLNGEWAQAVCFSHSEKRRIENRKNYERLSSIPAIVIGTSHEIWKVDVPTTSKSMTMNWPKIDVWEFKVAKMLSQICIHNANTSWWTKAITNTQQTHMHNKDRRFSNFSAHKFGFSSENLFECVCCWWLSASSVVLSRRLWLSSQLFRNWKRHWLKFSRFFSAGRICFLLLLLLAFVGLFRKCGYL